MSTSAPSINSELGYFINSIQTQQSMNNSTAAAAAAPQTAVMVVRNGKAIQALDVARLQAIISGTRVLTANEHGKYIDGIKIIGDGNFNPSLVQPSGKLSPASFIYNVNLISEVAMSGNKYQSAIAALNAAKGDVELTHDACNDVLNALRVSFNTPKKSFVNGQLIKGTVTVVTTEKGSLIKMENVTAMPAENASILTKGLTLVGLDSAVAAQGATPIATNPFATATQA
jgi:hypothetical protein